MGDAYERGVLLYDRGRYAMAADEFRRELQADPSSALAMAMLGLSLSFDNQHDAGEAAVTQALALDSDEAFAHYAMASVIIRRPYVTRMRSFRLTMGDDARRNYLSRLNRARVYSIEAIRLDAYSAEYLSMLAAIECDLGRPYVTLALGTKALALEPDHERSANLRSSALRSMGYFEEARQALDHTLSRNPERADTQLNCGIACLLSGDPKSAIGHLNESLRIEPGNKSTLAALTEAKQQLDPLNRWWQRLNFWMNRTFGPLALFRAVFLAALIGNATRERSNGSIALIAIVGLLFVAIPWMRSRRRRILRQRAGDPDRVLSEILQADAKRSTKRRR